MSDWQPIETAPKDGTRVLLYRPHVAESMAPRVVQPRVGRLGHCSGRLSIWIAYALDAAPGASGGEVTQQAIDWSRDVSLPIAGRTLFWASQLTILTVMVSFGLLFVQAAASRITFASDNRATNLRVTIVIQFVLYVAWTCYYLTYEFDSEIIFILMMFPAMYAAVVGAMMIGESPVLSPRVRRQLPQSFLGRAAFTWFNPGSATGYFFVVSCLLGVP